MMSSDEFYESADPQNMVKTRIVIRYFGVWTEIILNKTPYRDAPIAYVDLFCGPGRFDDGIESTPLWVLRHAIKDARLCQRLNCHFNDKESKWVAALQQELLDLDGNQKLANQPVVTNLEVGPNVIQMISRQMPTLYFVDPWGYKGLSIDLLGKALAPWGCDLIFFFNYNRINPGLSNNLVAPHMREIFGAERFERLATRIDLLRNSQERQDAILEELISALRDVGGRYVLPFEFQGKHGRTSHYIIFVSKARRGYEIMKEIMEKLSSDDAVVKEFVFIPVPSAQMRLPGDIDKQYSIPILKDQLMRVCAGQTLSVDQIYSNYSLDTPYLKKHFKSALVELEDIPKVTIEPPRERRIRGGKVTLGDSSLVTFPTLMEN